MDKKEEKKFETTLSSIFRKEIAILEIKQTNMIEKIDDIKDDINKVFHRADKAFVIATTNQTKIRDMKETFKSNLAIAGFFMTVISVIVSWITSMFHKN